MRLKQHDDAAPARTDFGCRQGRLNFRRVVAVIIDNHHAASFAFKLKSPAGSVEARQRFGYLCKRHV